MNIQIPPSARYRLVKRVSFMKLICLIRPVVIYILAIGTLWRIRHVSIMFISCPLTICLGRILHISMGLHYAFIYATSARLLAMLEHMEERIGTPIKDFGSIKQFHQTQTKIKTIVQWTGAAADTAFAFNLMFFYLSLGHNVSIYCSVYKICRIYHHRDASMSIYFIIAYRTIALMSTFVNINKKVNVQKMK